MNGQDDDQKMMKDIGLNDPVSLELPAHIWTSFIATYSAAKWASSSASAIYNAAIKAMIDPGRLAEMEAEQQQQQELHDSIKGIMTGRRPDGAPLNPIHGNYL